MNNKKVGQVNHYLYTNLLNSQEGTRTQEPENKVLKRILVYKRQKEITELGGGDPEEAS